MTKFLEKQVSSILLTMTFRKYSNQKRNIKKSTQAKDIFAHLGKKITFRPKNKAHKKLAKKKNKKPSSR